MIMATMGVGVEWLDVVVWMALLMMCACVPLRFVRQIYSTNWQCQRDKQTVRDIYANCQIRYTQWRLSHFNAVHWQHMHEYTALCSGIEMKIVFRFFSNFWICIEFQEYSGQPIRRYKRPKISSVRKIKAWVFFLESFEVLLVEFNLISSYIG